MSRPDYDVVVVGARVAGASTAMLLARSGLRVGLVDRSAPGSDALSTHGLMRAGVLQLSRWGLLPAVVSAGTPPVHRTLFHYGGDTVLVTIRPSPGVPALYAPRRTVLDRLLVDAAADAGADVAHHTTVVGLVRERRRVAGVRVRTSAGREHALTAPLTVGADGVRSTVASAAGAVVERQAAHAGAVLYRYHAGMPTDGYEWCYRPGAAAGLIPTNDGLTCVFVGTTPATMRQLRSHGVERAFDQLFAAAAPEHVDRLNASGAAGRVHGWAGLPGYVRRSWGAGWALVGDAGYFKDPLTTHGMTDALRDAELLSRAVLAAASGHVAQAGALAGYQRVRDTLSEPLFLATDRVAGFEWDTAGVQTLLRQVSSAMTSEVELLQTLPPVPGARATERVLIG